MCMVGHNEYLYIVSIDKKKPYLSIQFKGVYPENGKKQ